MKYLLATTNKAKIRYYGTKLKKRGIEIITLEDLNIEVLWDLDIGHVKPSVTLINGDLATIQYEEGKGSIQLNLK